MRALHFVDNNVVTACASCVDFIPARLVLIAIGFQDLDVLLCHNAMPVFCGCPSFQTYPGLENFALRLLVVLGAVLEPPGPRGLVQLLPLQGASWQY